VSQSLLLDDCESSDAEFSGQEGPSFCSRPTPVTAVPESLRAFVGDGTSEHQSGIVPRSSRVTNSVRPSSDSLDQEFFAAVPKPSLPPSILPVAAPRPVSRARMVLSLLLFVTLFGGVALLLVLALLKKFALSPGAFVALV
jgi:hypothetical protein